MHFPCRRHRFDLLVCLPWAHQMGPSLPQGQHLVPGPQASKPRFPARALSSLLPDRQQQPNWETHGSLPARLCPCLQQAGQPLVAAMQQQVGPRALGRGHGALFSQEGQQRLPLVEPRLVWARKVA